MKLKCNYFAAGESERQGVCAHPAVLSVGGKPLDKSRVRTAHCLTGCPEYDGPPKTPKDIAQTLMGLSDADAVDIESREDKCRKCPAFVVLSNVVVKCTRSQSCCGVSLINGSCPDGKW